MIEVQAHAYDLLKKHGSNAAEVAFDMMNQCLNMNDAKGAALWLSVHSVVEERRVAQLH